MRNNIYLLSFLSFIIPVLIGCAKSDDSSSSSSSSSEDVAAASGSGAITLSSKVSVVEPKTTDSTARTANAIDTTDFATTADYNLDESSTFVFEQSADVLDTVNKILCMIGQSRPGLMLNAGSYKAQIDENKCEDGKGDSQSNTPSYSMWTLNATRTEGEPMIVKAWVPEGDDEINALMKVYRKPSTEYPIGFFKMNFKKVKSDGTEGMKGYMRTKKTSGGTQLVFYQPYKVGSTTFDFSVKVNFNSDGSGTGATSMPNWTGDDQAEGSKSFQVAYNSNYFYKQKTLNGTTSNPVCLDRNKYMKSAWNYGMYDSNGARVDISSGFPISATVSNTKYHGYIGYHGLWMPSAANIGDNSTVYKMDFSNPDSDGTLYTVRKFGGKLVKYTKKTITLSTIKKIPLNWWDNAAAVEKRVYWDGSNLKADAKRVQGQWQDMTEETITLTATNASYGFNFWSRALGGDGQIVLVYPNGFGQAPTAPADNSSVIFNIQDPVFPGDSVPSTLACYGECPNPSTLATGYDYYGASSSIYHGKHDNWLGWDSTNNRWAKNSTLDNNSKSEFDNVSSPSPYVYTFDNTTNGMVLKYGGTDVVLSSENENIRWGARSGVLFDNSTFDNNTSARQADFASLLCSWDTTKICPWQARGGLSTFYVWETGHQSWNQLSVLVGSDNSSVEFDPPMIVKYTHSGTKSNSGKSYDGSAFYLEYGGLGDLHGIPSFCVNRKTGEKSNCDDDSRWVNEFVIPAASNVIQAKDGTTEYVIKPLQIEQTMKKASSTSTCTEADLSLGTVSLPDSSGWVDPDLEDKPNVTGPPSVVVGEKTTD